MRALAAIGLLLAMVACGDDRVAIDPAPYDRPCTRAPDSCPAPYRCTASDALGESPPGDRCYVPCEHAATDCPPGYVCNGEGITIVDLGPTIGYCAPEPP